MAMGEVHGYKDILGLVALQDCMVGLLFAFMPVLANNRSGGNVDHFDVVRLLFR